MRPEPFDLTPRWLAMSIVAAYGAQRAQLHGSPIVYQDLRLLRRLEVKSGSEIRARP